jgi:hypothetical protein
VEGLEVATSPHHHLGLTWTKTMLLLSDAQPTMMMQMMMSRHRSVQQQ